MPSPLIVIAGPTGAGKTTVADLLLKRKKIPLKRFISCTTRKKRPTEKNHREYHFLTTKQFEEEIGSNKFFEWTKSFGTYYGNRYSDIQTALKGKIPGIFINGDIKGIRKLKQQYPDTLIIFLKSGISDLKERIKNRNFTKKELTLRLNKMRADMKVAKLADLIVENKNDKLLETVKQIEQKLPALIKQRAKKSARS